MTLRSGYRLALGYLALVAVQIGGWALLAPRSFYDDFPGLGRAWVSVDGPYNEHLVRDVGGLYLALAVVTVAAAITLSRALILTTAVASLVTGLPHLVYHVVNRDDLGAGDALASIAGMALAVVIPIALIVVTVGSGEPAAAVNDEE